MCRRYGDRKLLVSPTLIRIGLDKEKADPYYIAAYLSSAEGKAMLDGCRSGKVLRYCTQRVKGV